MEIILEFIKALGLPAGIAVLWAFVYYQSKAHREERTQWRSSNEDMMKLVIQSLEHNTAVLSELKTLIKSK